MAKPLLPAPYVVFKDGQLPKGPLPSGIFVFIGVGESGAAAGVLTPVNSPNDIRGLFGTGPLARYLSTAFLGGIGFAYAIRLAPTTVGTIGAPTVGGFTAGALAGTVHNAYQVRVRPSLGGALGVAQVRYSLDGGRTWGEPRVLASGANKVIGPDNFDSGLTFSTSVALLAVGDVDFSCDTVAPLPSDADVKSAMDTCIQDASTFFNGFVICSDKDDDAETISWLNDIDAKLVDAENTWFKYLYAICPSTSVSTTPALALASMQAIRAGVASRRAQVAAMPAILKSLGGQYVMSIAPIMAARRASLEPQNDLGMVRGGPLTPVVGFAPGWSSSSVTAIDLIRNGVTIRQHVGVGGFYFTNDWMSDPTSDYSKSCRRLVADLVAADIRAAGMPFLKMDVDPLDPSASGEVLLGACRGPLEARKRNKQISDFDISIPEGQDILTTEELVVEVAIIPMGTASWIRFNLGFKSPFAGG